MDTLLILPIIVPLIAACITIGLLRWTLWQALVTVANTLVLLGLGVALIVASWDRGVIATQVADWPAPFGITLVSDMFSAIMVLLASIVALCAAIYSAATIDRRRAVFGYYPLFNILLMGVMGAFLTGDLFNLYVWFEVLLISSFVLLGLGGSRGQMEGAIKYVVLNLISSVFFLSGVGLIYGVAGTLNMADLSLRLAEVEDTGLVVTISMLFLVAFGVKAAIFPVFSWLPASYHTPPLAVSALFAGLLTKVGVYSLIRVFSLLFADDQGYTQELLIWIAGFTMVTGVLGAAAQNEFRRILSFHIISQIGYMVMGLAFFTPLGYAAAIYFIAHNMFAKTGLFIVAGLSYRLLGSYELKKLGGLIRFSPEITILFFICAFSLAGLPPLAGFFGKFALARAGFEAEHYVIVGVSLAVGLLTMYSMTKIWAEAFWKPFPGDAPADLDARRRQPRMLIMAIPALIFAGLSIGAGVAAGPVFELMERAGNQLADPSGYIIAVLGSDAQ
jgi:multicomponent Na+:H+ antiporter subunit D